MRRRGNLYDEGMTSNPALTVRRATERGHANHGWLDSWHTFSFADYYDPSHMGFRSLRVINDDTVAPKAGFPTHPHRDMEIFSYVLDGALAHEDSLGNKRELKPGEIQLMRAGSGVRHSEYNPLASGRSHFLQVWITPHTRGLQPAYSEWKPTGPAEAKTLVISPDGRDGSATIAQDAFIHLIRMQAGEHTGHHLAAGRGLWLHVARGKMTVNGIKLEDGDAVSLEEGGDIQMSADGPVEALLFDLA